MTADVNPYQVTTETLVRNPALDPIQAIPRWLQIVVIIVQTFVGLATLAACIDIESITVSGPILFCIGLVLLLVTRRRRFGFEWVALWHTIFPVFIVVLIWVQSWSPSEAQVPVSVICGIYALIISLMVLRILRRNRVAMQQPDSSFAESMTVPDTPGTDALPAEASE